MTNKKLMLKNTFAFYFSFLLFTSCSTQKQISKLARSEVLDKSEVAPAHVGISIFDLANNKFIYNYQADKYFIPASNTKLFTLYAGLKYLKDSIVAARYTIEDSTLILQATGDPTFLHPDFKNQPLLNFLQKKDIQVIRLNTSFASQSLGDGWTWNDFESDYMAERDPFPIYGNLATVIFESDTIRTIPASLQPFIIGMPEKGKRWSVTRELAAHSFTIDTSRGTTAPVKTITMAMNKGLFAPRYLNEILHKPVLKEYSSLNKDEGIPIYSQPRDSLFKVMMHRSDNFFAEQTLLMSANELLGEMSDERLIDTLLKKDLAELPQKPRLVDGSGLSRYNLVSPKDFVWLLNKLQAEFGIERLKVILPGANEGTLENLYKGYEGRIFAKTGTLSNHVALSGYLFTKKNKQLLFSIMVGGYQTLPSVIRREVEKFLTSIIDKY